MSLESRENTVVPLKTWEPGNHPNLTDVSLRQVGWLRSGQFPQYPTDTRQREPLRVRLCAAPGCQRFTCRGLCERCRSSVPGAKPSPQPCLLRNHRVPHAWTAKDKP